MRPFRQRMGRKGGEGEAGYLALPVTVPATRKRLVARGSHTLSAAGRGWDGLPCNTSQL